MKKIAFKSSKIHLHYLCHGAQNQHGKNQIFNKSEFKHYLFLAGKIVLRSEKEHAVALLPAKQNQDVKIQYLGVGGFVAHVSLNKFLKHISCQTSKTQNKGLH